MTQIKKRFRSKKTHPRGAKKRRASFFAAIRTADFDACLAAYRARPGKIVIATRDGRRGHPIILPAELADAVRSPLCDDGLNCLTRNRDELVLEAVCGSDGILTDIDTPDDLERL